jgi:hypothetical protein
MLGSLIAFMTTLALNSGLWVRRLLINGSPFQVRGPASEANDLADPENPDHLTGKRAGGASLHRLRIIASASWA